MMDLAVIERFIDRFGFALLVALYFMWRDRTIMTSVMNRLNKLTIGVFAIATELDLRDTKASMIHALADESSDDGASHG